MIVVRPTGIDFNKNMRPILNMLSGVFAGHVMETIGGMAAGRYQGTSSGLFSSPLPFTTDGRVISGTNNLHRWSRAKL